MEFSVITPSFRSSRWLPLCIASVADQQVNHEHIIQDAVSDDGTLEWLPKDSRVKAFVERDLGMYDAVNRGLRRSKGQILAYLNCDEQYLPGALRAVSEFFAANPQVDVAFAHTVVVNSEGEYRFHRKALMPAKHQTSLGTNLTVFTCATFFRRKVIEGGLFFNPELRDLGDADWVLRLIQSRTKMAAMPGFTSVFTQTGANMGQGSNAKREREQMLRSAPFWVRKLKVLFRWEVRVRRLISGGYFQRPFDYAIYTQSSNGERKRFSAARPTTRWLTS
jgi:glycosyltransferase involved in cell wall biosynthesis